MAESSTTIAVMWEEVPPIDQNGVITMYEVMYTLLETFGGTLENDTITVFEPARSVNLTGLEEYVNYNISVRAFNSVGAGPYSVAVTVLTLQDSKYIVRTHYTLTIVCMLHRYIHIYRENARRLALGIH